MDKHMIRDRKLKSSLFEYIEIFYNRKRRRSYLGLVSPRDFEYMYNQKTYENAAWICVYKKQERSLKVWPTFFNILTTDCPWIFYGSMTVLAQFNSKLQTWCYTNSWKLFRAIYFYFFGLHFSGKILYLVIMNIFKNKTQKDNVAKFFYDSAKIIFAIVVLG